LIILDTNVVSEMQRPLPDAQVLAWLESSALSAAYLTAITAAELRFGVAIMPEGRRRVLLSRSVDTIIDADFAGRVLAFDTECAVDYAHISATRRRLGKPIGMADAQIAAIARRHGARLATRNVADFQDCGIDLINPWEPG
jgi:toxin FitB